MYWCGESHFCISEATAYYLQESMYNAKRKIFFMRGTIDAFMIEIIKKHLWDEKFPPSVGEFPIFWSFDKLDENKIAYAKAVMYKTVCGDLSDLANIFFDVLVFFPALRYQIPAAEFS